MNAEEKLAQVQSTWSLKMNVHPLSQLHLRIATASAEEVTSGRIKVLMFSVHAVLLLPLLPNT